MRPPRDRPLYLSCAAPPLFSYYSPAFSDLSSLLDEITRAATPEKTAIAANAAAETTKGMIRDRRSEEEEEKSDPPASLPSPPPRRDDDDSSSDAGLRRRAPLLPSPPLPRSGDDSFPFAVDGFDGSYRAGVAPLPASNLEVEDEAWETETPL